MIVPLKERAHLVQPDGVEIRDLADRRPVIRMIGREERREHRHRREAVGAILVILAPLVQHDVALVGELGFGQRRQQKAHAVRFHPQRELERAGGHDFPVVGAIGVGRSVQRGARALKRMKVAAVVVLRSLEHQVLEEVREAGVARPLVLRSDVIPEVHGDDRAGVVLVQQHVEAVGERVLREPDVQRPMLNETTRRSASRCRSTDWRASTLPAATA